MSTIEVGWFFKKKTKTMSCIIQGRKRPEKCFPHVIKYPGGKDYFWFHILSKVDPEWKPTELFLVTRIKPYYGTPRWEKAELKFFEIERDMNRITRDDFDAGPTSINEVERGLWLGNLTAALDIQTLENYKIDFILTVDTCPLLQTVTFSPNITTKLIKISDLPYEDLLSHLDDTYNFIINGMQKGSVLVHCYYGVSRSAAVVIAFLMKKYSLSFDHAYEKLKEKRKFIGPNIGFENQLRLYETLNFSIDKSNLQYRLFRLRVTANQVAKVKIVPHSCQDVIKSDPNLATVKPNPRVYRCKKCRRVVASVDNLLPHVKNEKLSWKDRKWSDDYSSLNLCSQTYFIEPLKWIDSIHNSENGKIKCPKCKVKLGSFNWVMGSQCSCGARVSPSFYLIPSKVDYSDFVQNVQVTV